MAYGFNEDKSKISVLPTGALHYFETDWSDTAIEQYNFKTFYLRNIPENYRLISCEYQMATDKSNATTWRPLSNDAKCGPSSQYEDNIYHHTTLHQTVITKYNPLTQPRYIRVRGLFVDISSADDISDHII